jgi:hypothetical protein
VGDLRRLHCSSLNLLSADPHGSGRSAVARVAAKVPLQSSYFVSEPSTTCPRHSQVKEHRLSKSSRAVSNYRGGLGGCSAGLGDRSASASKYPRTSLGRVPKVGHFELWTA